MVDISKPKSQAEWHEIICNTNTKQGSGSGSGKKSSGGGGGGGGGQTTVDVTAEAEAKLGELVENKNNDYHEYWTKEGTEEHRITTSTPNVHIYISKQILGTELAARPYDNQLKKEEESEKKEEDTEKDDSKTKSTDGEEKPKSSETKKKEEELKPHDPSNVGKEEDMENIIRTTTVKNNSINQSNTVILKDNDGKEYLVHQAINKFDF